MRIDLHNHTTLCNHATGSNEEYIQKAIELGIDIYGFSDHAPMKFEPEYRMNLTESKTYEKEILQLKEKYKNDIEILLAYEVDFMNNESYIENDILNSKVDYLIGSVHFIKEWGFDNPAYIKYFKSKDINSIWIEYFNTVEQMAKSKYFDVVGHFDLIKLFNYLPKKDIKSIAYKALKQIKKSNMVLEINSAGLRKPINEMYPSKSILQLAYELDIDITFSSDAHSIDQVGYKYDEVSKIAREVGYKNCVSFIQKDKILHKF